MSKAPVVPKRVIEHSVEYLVPGMELARDLHSEDGKILINGGTTLTKQVIRNLKNWHIPSIPVMAEVPANPLSDPKVQQFVNTYNQSVSVIQKTFDTIRETQDISLETFQETASLISDGVSQAGNIIDQLYNLPHQCDTATYHHSVNVSAIAALIATWLKLPADVINAVSLAGLMHDVGKSQLPADLLNKPYKLPEKDYELYQKHTEFGHQLVSKLPGIAESVVAGIKEHHEREDGSGYPFGLRSEDIHPYAKIVAIADLYDEALTINREEGPVFSPYTSLDKLRDEVYRLEPKACITFINNMTNFLSCNQVVLTNGCQGRVVFVNKDQPSRSMVQLINGTVVDLAEEDNILIHYVIR